MKIKDNTSTKKAFTDIKVGEVFNHDNKYYMKIKEIGYPDRYGGVILYNAVDIELGCVACFGDLVFVTPVDAKLTINK